MYQLFISIIAFMLLAGCGSGKQTQKNTIHDDIVLDQNAKNYFGTLANAEVRIYELTGEEKKLLFKEYTTSGNTTEEIGNFDPHLRHMTREKHYLYEVSGGENWDSDKDGIIDSSPTQNKAVFRSVYKGFRTKVKWWHVQNHGNTIGLSEK